MTAVEVSESTAQLVRTFVRAFDDQDLNTLDRVLDGRAQWWMAIGEPHATRLRPLNCTVPHGRNIVRARLWIHVMFVRMAGGGRTIASFRKKAANRRAR